MAFHNDIGHRGEALAKQYLIDHGYAILETNWRIGRQEADIVAYYEGLIVFVEVKTRSSVEYGLPEEAVTRNKQRSYIRLANAYVLHNHREEEVRFDVISIVIHNQDNVEINHIANAFSAIDCW